MKRAIIFVFDDITQTPPQIRALIDCDHFGEVVRKRSSLAQEFKAIATNLTAQRFVHLKSAQDRTNLMDELLATGVEQNTIIHCDSAISIVDHPAFVTSIEQAVISGRFLSLDDQLSVVCTSSAIQYKEYLQLKYAQRSTPARIIIDQLNIVIKTKQLVLRIDNFDNFLDYISGELDTRHFNQVSSDLYFITKRSTDKDKIQAEYQFFSLIPEAMQIWFVQPFDFQINDDIASYRMERLKLPDVAVLWIHGAINSNQFGALLNKLALFLASRAETKVDKTDVAATFDSLYLTKVKTRHDQLKQWPLYNKFDKLIAGGTEFDSIDQVYEKYYQALNKVKGSLLKYAKQRKVVGHGDPCFSNILYDKQTGLLRLIDPKGATTEPEIWTDFFYDFAKIFHSILGDYDYINNGIYSVEMNAQCQLEVVIDHRTPALKTEFIDYIHSLGINSQELRVLECSLFLSMLPLHIDMPHKVFALLVRGIEILREAQ
ncbi:MAG: hypothetical protein HRT35_11960 [Algicola sp.]|nr:hypothetical protein [Algicola sp.]